MCTIPVVDYSDVLSAFGGDQGCGRDGGGGGGADDADRDARVMAKIAAAFGGDGGGTGTGRRRASPGLLAIRNVPGFVDARDALLPLAHSLAHLPADYLETKLSDPCSSYNAGWSHGKEKLRPDVPDVAKGSFYFNPLADRPGADEDRRRYPASYPANVWPDEGAGVLPGFRDRAVALGRIMHAATVALARCIDAHVVSALGAQMDASCARGQGQGHCDEAHGGGGHQSAPYRPSLLYDAMRTTDKAKGRLLYYFPLDDHDHDHDHDHDDHTHCGNNDADDAQRHLRQRAEDSWIGWHNDSGFLTALAGDMYVDDDTGDVLDPSLVDDEAGLYVVDRAGNAVRVDMPNDCMAVQIGECAQIVTGGAVVATPHCVRAARGWQTRQKGGESTKRRVKVSRISCPCFIDTAPSFPLRAPSLPLALSPPPPHKETETSMETATSTLDAQRKRVLDASIGTDKVPPLELRWTDDGMAFGDFLAKTFATYYDWNEK